MFFFLIFRRGGGIRRAGAWPAAPPGPVRAGLDRFWEQSGLAGNIFNKKLAAAVSFSKNISEVGSESYILCDFS